MGNRLRFLLISIFFLFIIDLPTQEIKKSNSSNIDNKSCHSPISERYVIYQVVLDVEDPSFKIISGNWTLSKIGSFYGNYYYRITGPGKGTGLGRWIAEGLPPGKYLVEFYANNDDYAKDARYQVVSQDGIQNVTIDMNHITNGWHPLGRFNINGTCVVNISDYWEEKGTLLSADALRFTLQTPPPSPPSFSIPPHIGICIDDAGNVSPIQPGKPIYKMLRIPFKMTFAVMPYGICSIQTAEEVYKMGSEVILHQPMSAKGISNPGPGSVTNDMKMEEVRKTVSTNLDSLPHVMGMNNHMGSLITQQDDKMQACMEELKIRNLYFYDNHTIATSIGYDKAKDQGLLTGRRDVFIDGKTKEQSKELIRNLALRALYAPHVTFLATGHVRTNTADALTEIVPELNAMGVEIWPISKCLSQTIESDNIPYEIRVKLWNDNANTSQGKVIITHEKKSDTNILKEVRTMTK